MPPTTSGERSKRKRVSASEKPTKRQRSLSSESESEDPNAKILLMEQGILESRKHYNDITVLLSAMDDFDSDSPEPMLATVALCRIFVRLLAQGSLTSKKNVSEKDSVVIGWLREQFAEYKSKLLAILQDEELAATALTLSMRALKAEGDYLYDKEDYKFPKAFLKDIVSTLILSDNEEVVKVYVEEFVEQYDDIRYFTFNSVKYEPSNLFIGNSTNGNQVSS